MYKPSDSVRRVLRVVGLLVGGGLIVAAVVLALRHVHFDVLAQAKPWQWATLVAAVGANLVLAAAIFWAVTLSFDAQPAVSYGRMFLLIAGSALVNYLPLQAGMMGRAAWLKLRHRLPLRQSAMILGVVMVLTLVVAGGIVLAIQHPPQYSRMGLWFLGVGAVLAVGVLARVYAGLILRRAIVRPGYWVPFKTADVLVSGLRMYIALAVVGSPVSYGQAVVIAAAGAVMSMLAPTPNGLGLKEWAMAATAQASAAAGVDVALVATLIDRGVEAIVTVPVGIVALALLKRIKGPEERVEIVD